MWCFMRQQVEVAVMEVGLGGRLDAVNVFDPDCAVVTAVDIDHIEFLGNSRESIGFEKAGIFRKHVPAICGDFSPPQSLVEHARVIGADLQLRNRDFKLERHGDCWDFKGAALMKDLPLPALSGEFQLDNAACALAAVEVMQDKLPVSVTAIEAGLKSVSLAGRFQIVAQYPEILLDVTHNPHAACALAENLRQTRSEGKTIAVFAMLADKDIAGVISALTSEIDGWYLSSVDHVRSASTSQLVETFNKINIDASRKCFESLADAFRQACLDAGKNDRIIVFGSFFTVAEVMHVLAAPITHRSS